MLPNERWDQQLESLRKEQGIAGLVVAVTDRERLVYCGGFGTENLERPFLVPNEHSLHRIASISKVITGITVLRMQEEGLLNIDCPIRVYLPWLTMEREDAANSVTLRHLLSHTAGLPAEYAPVGAREEDACLREVQAALPELPLHWLPGKGGHLYSNWGFRMIACVVQAVTGRYFSEAAREYALQPLGMDRTTYDLRVAATYPMSLPHEPDESGALKVLHGLRENAARLATGGLYSNAEQLGKLCRFLLNGGRNEEGAAVLQPESFRQMVTAHAPFEGDYQQYGLSMMMMEHEGRTLLGHLGSAPPYMSSIFTDPVSGYGVITLMNTARPSLRTQIPKLLFGDLYRV